MYNISIFFFFLSIYFIYMTKWFIWGCADLCNEITEDILRIYILYNKRYQFIIWIIKGSLLNWKTFDASIYNLKCYACYYLLLYQCYKSWKCLRAIMRRSWYIHWRLVFNYNFTLCILFLSGECYIQNNLEDTIPEA